MTILSTKELLKSFPILKGKHKIITGYSQLTSSNKKIVSNDILHTSLLLELIETCLTVITEEEKFVIETHLMKHFTWPQIELLFEQRWGPEHMRSERTLKRMQKNALYKITEFINNNELEQFMIDSTITALPQKTGQKFSNH